MHIKRLIVAAILVPFLYAVVMFLPAEYFFFLIVILSSLALLEFYAMFRLEGLMKYIGMLWGAALLAVFYTSREHFATVVFLFLLTIMTVRLFFKNDPESSHGDVSIAVLGLLYIPGLLTFQLGLAKASPIWIIFLYASVWAADSLAYYVGKGIGRRKLYERISPNKTVEGAVGSVIGGILGALFINAVLLHLVSLSQVILLGLSMGVVTIIGDLVESMFKRDAGVKDSSHIIPGHGGVLDKIDGVTFAGPVLYWFCLGLGLIR
ncbi:MAG: phosphatidate cytidylyltransferase [Candidatus Sulfobium sp.]|jgi:phosphatidate cytidylyltransferase